MNPALRRILALTSISFALPLFAATTAVAETVDTSSLDASTADVSGAIYSSLAQNCAYSTRTVAVLDDAPTTPRGYDAASRSLTTSGPVSRGYQCDEALTTQSINASSAETPGAVAAASVTIGTKTFLPSSPTFTFRSAEADFDAQTNFLSSGYPAAFGYQINNVLTDIATGPTEIASVVRAPANCTYNKPGVSVVYLFHWSRSGQKTGTGYVLTGHWRFPVEVWNKARSHRPVLDFHYIIYTRIT